MGETPPAVVRHRIGRYSMSASTDFGPRVIELAFDDGNNLFAVLDDSVLIEKAGQAPYVFRGGHRLWAAPEVPDITHVSDAHACEVGVDADRMTITGPMDGAGFTKSMSIWGRDDDLVIEHRLSWHGAGRSRVAAWAITQFPLGGIALLPIESDDGSGLQADRSLVLWPYTNLADHRLNWQNRMVLVECSAGPRLKIGAGPSPRRLGYLHDGQLFVKILNDPGSGDYPDRGAVGQVFVDSAFAELETVGPLVDLDQDDSIVHRETWRVRTCSEVEQAAALLGEA